MALIGVAVFQNGFEVGPPNFFNLQCGIENDAGPGSIQEFANGRSECVGLLPAPSGYSSVRASTGPANRFEIPPPVTIIFTAYGLAPDERRLTAEARLSIFQETKFAIKSRDGQQVISLNAEGDTFVASAYADEYVTFRVIIEDQPEVLAGTAVAVEIPLSVLTGEVPSQEGVSVVSPRGVADTVIDRRLDIPMTPHTTSFPDDWYALGGIVELRLPASLEFDRGASSQTAIPVQITLESTAGMVGKDILFQRESHASITDPKIAPASPLRFAVVRTASDRLFLYAAALLPLVFAAIMITRHVSPASRPQSDTVVSVAAGAISVLSLRAVLVPPDVPGLTRIDAMLAMGVAAILLLPLVDHLAARRHANSTLGDASAREVPTALARETGHSSVVRRHPG